MDKRLAEIKRRFDATGDWRDYREYIRIANRYGTKISYKDRIYNELKLFLDCPDADCRYKGIQVRIANPYGSNPLSLSMFNDGNWREIKLELHKMRVLKSRKTKPHLERFAWVSSDFDGLHRFDYIDPEQTLEQLYNIIR
jgi:hypothetical protein